MTKKVIFRLFQTHCSYMEAVLWSFHSFTDQKVINQGKLEIHWWIYQIYQQDGGGFLQAWDAIWWHSSLLGCQKLVVCKLNTLQKGFFICCPKMLAVTQRWTGNGCYRGSKSNPRSDHEPLDMQHFNLNGTGILRNQYLQAQIPFRSFHLQTDNSLFSEVSLHFRMLTNISSLNILETEAKWLAGV